MFTKNAIYKLIKECANFQDSVLILSAFEGISIQEICNLKIEDLDNVREALSTSTYSILLSEDDGKTRLAQITNDLLQLMISASKQDSYIKRNGMFTEGTKSENLPLQTESPYVLKLTSNSNNTKPEKFMVHRRMSMLSETFELDLLTFKMVRYCGMLYKYKTLLEEEKSESDVFNEIGFQFNLTIVDGDGGAKQFVIQPYVRDFLNKANLEKVYYDKVTDAIDEHKNDVRQNSQPETDLSLALAKIEALNQRVFELESKMILFMQQQKK